MDELTPHPDPMVEAGRRWMRSELSSTDYFAMARRQARPEPRALRSWRRLREAMALRRARRYVRPMK